MDETRRKQLLERRRRARAIDTIGRMADDIFARTYRYSFYRWIEIQAAKGMERSEASEKAFRMLGRIEEELFEQGYREARIKHALEHDDGFMDSAGEDIPFGDTG